MNIQAVVFDAVGTILHPSPSVADVYFRVGRDHGSRLGRDEILRRFRAGFAREEAIDAEQGHVTSEVRESQRWQRIVAHVFDDVVSTEACFNDLFTHFGRPDAWHVDPTLEAVLAELKRRGVRRILASNFDARLYAIAAGKPELAGIDELFVSSTVGWKKPALEFFRHLARALGIPSQAMLVVGDNFANDVEAALDAGFQAAWLSASVKEGVRSIATIEKVLGLL